MTPAMHGYGTVAFIVCDMCEDVNDSMVRRVRVRCFKRL